MSRPSREDRRARRVRHSRLRRRFFPAIQALEGRQLLSPPTLAPIANQNDTSGQPLTVTLQGADSDGNTLTYSASAETQLYWLEQTYGFYEDPNGYYTDARGQQEVYLRAKVSVNGYNTGGVDPWYYILPNGNLYEFTPPYTNPPLTGVFMAQVGTAVYDDPSLLWNAQNTAVPATLVVSGNQLTITPSGSYTGTFVVDASDSDGLSSATSSFTVSVYPPPTLAAIAGQSDTQGQPLTVTLQGADSDGNTLTYSASAETQLYWLEQTYGFYEDPNGYYTNATASRRYTSGPRSPPTATTPALTPGTTSCPTATSMSSPRLTRPPR